MTVTNLGYCQCGCGEKTKLLRDTDKARGLMKGTPRRFLRGHSSRGQVLSDEVKAKIAAASRGELGNAWKGDDILYRAAHRRAQKAVAGMPCAHGDLTCKGPIHAAFQHDTPEKFVKVDRATGLLYSPRAEDYRPLCASHHRRYDLKQKQQAA